MEEKIYGLYPAGLNKEVVYNMAEWDVWSYINQTGGQLFWLRHEWADGRLDAPYESVKKEEQMLQYRIEFLVYSLKRFGVEFEAEPMAGEHIKTNQDSYWKWFEHWQNHWEKMPKEQYDEFCKIKRQGGDISAYLPKTKWNEEVCDQEQTKQ